MSPSTAKRLSSDAFKECTCSLICVLGNYACNIVLFDHLSWTGAFSVSFHSQLACTALFLCSVRCAARPNQRSEY